MRFLSAPLALVLAGAMAASAHAAPCIANQLSLAVDGENGNFNGMSHSGTLPSHRVDKAQRLRARPHQSCVH